MAVSVIFVQFKYVIFATMFYSLDILKTVKKNFIVSLCIEILAECTMRRVVGEVSYLIRFLGTVYVFCFSFHLFLLAFYFRIIIPCTTDFNPIINDYYHYYYYYCSHFSLIFEKITDFPIIFFRFVFGKTVALDMNLI